MGSPVQCLSDSNNCQQQTSHKYSDTFIHGELRSHWITEKEEDNKRVRISIMDHVIERFRRMFPDVVDVEAQFKRYDADGDGAITLEELIDGMTEFKELTREEASFAFELADSNSDGKIDISEFVTLMFPS